MKRQASHPEPADAVKRRQQQVIICYPTQNMPTPLMPIYNEARSNVTKSQEIVIPPRDARAFVVPKGCFFRIISVDGPQVGDLNLFALDNIDEHFYSGKTRALHGTHVSTGDRLWSCFPYLRPLATITHDTLDWYGWDSDGGSVHDVIGTRCDPYTNKLLSGNDYHYCCHSNLTRALSEYLEKPHLEAELIVHDVLNVFMCTGFTFDTHQYFMKASPARPDDFLEFFAEIDLLCALSACPGGDCGSKHSTDAVSCFPLKVEILDSNHDSLRNWSQPSISSYDRTHGLNHIQHDANNYKTEA